MLRTFGVEVQQLDASRVALRRGQGGHGALPAKAPSLSLCAQR